MMMMMMRRRRRRRRIVITTKAVVVVVVVVVEVVEVKITIIMAIVRYNRRRTSNKSALPIWGSQLQQNHCTVNLL